MEFDGSLWIRGCFASLLNVLGLIFVISALNTPNTPFGPVGALVNMQAILVTVIDAITSGKIPQPL